MAIRLRKLAGSVGVEPADVLGALRDLGLAQYKAETDQVPDDVAERVRKALRRTHGGSGTPPILPARPRAAKAAPDDLMAQLVPGVRPMHRAARQSPRPEPVEPPAVAAVAPTPTVAEPRPERRPPSPPQPPPAPQPPPLSRFLEGLAPETWPVAMARLARRLGPRLGAALFVVDGDAVAAALAPRVRPAVVEGDVRAHVSRIGDVLLLHGRRRVCVAGGTEEQHSAIRSALDRRVTWEARQVDELTVPEALVLDESAYDLGVAWALEGVPRGRWIHVEGPSIADLCGALWEALEGVDASGASP